MKDEFMSQMDSVSMEVLEQHNKMKWEIVKQKIDFAASRAVDQGDFVLATILHHARHENLESFWHEMERHDYNIEIHMPPDTIKTNGRHFFFDFTGMKLVIWKKVLEV